MSAIKLNYKIFALPLSVVLILVMSCEGLVEGLGGVEDEQPLGDWEIIEIDGSINDFRSGPGIEVLCDPYDNTYYPVKSDDQTYILFEDKNEELDPKSIPPEIINAETVPDDALEGLFIFTFTFDNGYYSTEFLLDLGLPSQEINIIPGASDYGLGLWTANEVFGIWHVSTESGGNTKFTVTGKFTSETRIEGEWKLDENTVFPGDDLPECNSEAHGEGKWVAERKIDLAPI